MTGVLTPTSYTVDPWDPGYGVARGDELDGRESSARLDLDIELPASSWRPLTPGDGPLPGSVLFLDGVRRIDARVWVHSEEPEPLPGVIASLAAGLVRCDGAAQIIDVAVDRGLYAETGSDIETRHARYRFHRTPGGLDKLTLGVQSRLSALEVELANAWRKNSNVEDDLLVVDGPLRGRTHLARRSRTCRPRRRRSWARWDRGSAARCSRWARPGSGCRGTCACRVRRGHRGRRSSGWNARPTCVPRTPSRWPT
jgi:hypothetical protein